MADQTYGFLDGSQYNVQGQQVAPRAPNPAALASLDIPKTISSSVLSDTTSNFDIQKLLLQNQQKQSDLFDKITSYFTPSPEEQQYQQQYLDYQRKIGDLQTQQDTLANDTQGQQQALGVQPTLTSIATAQQAQLGQQAAYKQNSLAIQQSALARQQQVALQTLQNFQASRQQKLDAAKFLYDANRNNLQDTLNLYKATAPENIGTQVNPTTGDVYVIARNPITGQVSTQVAGNVGPQKSYISSDIKEGADGQMYFVGVKSDGTVETQPLNITGKSDLDTLLTPDEAAKLSVPYGTTRREAASMGINPQTNAQYLDPKEKFQLQMDLKKNFDSITGTARIAENSYNEINAAYTQALKDLSAGKSLNASSQAVIVAFNKLIDPTSVVRESEYARTPEGQSLINRIAGKITQLQQGGAGLTPADLKGLVETANELVKGFQSQQLEQAQIAQQAADQYGLNLNLILPKSIINQLPKTGQQSSGSIPLTPLTGPANPKANPLIKKYPYQETALIIQQHPSATESDIRQILGLDSPKGKGSIPASSPVAPAAVKFPQGSTGGQCAVFAEKIVKLPTPGGTLGDGKYAKYAKVDRYGIPASEWRSQVKVGDVIITGENKTYGHVAIVNAILPNGKIQLTESNYHGNEKVTHTRIVSVNNPQIYGALRGTLKIKPSVA